jgi:hypothetical protein
MLDGSLLSLDHLRAVVSSPVFLVITAFQVWMLVDALRRREWVWAVFIALFSAITAVLYFFMVYRQAPALARGFELPGAVDRRRIKELQAQIHHLDKAHHHLQLGDIYFQQGKLAKAEACYRAALQRAPQDLDAQAHLGQCLLRLNRAGEALPLLEAVCRQDPQHDYGHSLMAWAEALQALGRTDEAIAAWQTVTQHHAYPRARVQLAELLLAKGQVELAKEQLQEVLADDPHAPAFQRKRDRVWVRRAQRLWKRLS